MTKKTSWAKEAEILRKKIYKNRKLMLEGRMLAIDPSCVSSSSKPGYAIFEKGKFTEQGILDIPYHVDLARRLIRIRENIELYFKDSADIVFIEKIPPKPLFTKKKAEAKGKMFMNLKSHGSIMQAIGATKCSFNEDTPIIDLPAGIWSWFKKKHELQLEKNDDNDAFCIGWCALTILHELMVDEDE